MALDPADDAVPGSVRAELVAALEAGGRRGADAAHARRTRDFVMRVAGRVRRPETPMGPSAVKAAKVTRRLTARFGFDDDVAEVFVALAAAVADEAADLYAEEKAEAASDRDDQRFERVTAVADKARVRSRLGTAFVHEVVPSVATGLAAFVPGLALRRPLDHPSVAVGAAVAGGLASTAVVGTSAVPVALALSVVTEAAETYAQSSLIVARFRREGIEPTAADLVDELAAVAGDGILGRSRPQASAVLRTAALPRLATTLERRVGLRVASLLTIVGPALIEGGLVSWGLFKASRHKLRRGATLPPAPGAE